MYSLFSRLLEPISEHGPFFAYLITIAAWLFIFIVVRKIKHMLLYRFFAKIASKAKNKSNNWAAVLVKNKFFSRLTYLILPILLSIITTDIGRHPVFWSRTIAILLIIISVFSIDAFIRSVGDIYDSYEVSKTVPLRGVLQVLEIIVFVVGAIIFVSVLVDRNPAALLGGLGAMTAIVTIVFKDAILGFIAGIQLAANDMVRVGDTIEIPQRNILGTVTEISLITVKAEAHDKTILAIPAYTFVSEPFTNRRGMVTTGARRIMRSFNIDVNSICVCDTEMADKLREISLIKNYVQAEMTNIGILREYITAYLKTREDINQDLTLLVRQLQAADVGIPLEIYAFATETDLVAFEKIQSDIFEHVYAIMPQFGLQLYQRLSNSNK